MQTKNQVLNQFMSNPMTVMLFFPITHLAGISELALTILIVFVTIIVTNFCNSGFAGLNFTPVILAFCGGRGFAAILYDNPSWISRKNVAVNTLISSGIIIGLSLWRACHWPGSCFNKFTIRQ